MPSLNDYLTLSAILFAIGTAGVFVRRNLITILLSIEIMLNAVNLTFVAVGRFLGTVDGQIIVFFVMTVAAAERRGAGARALSKAPMRFGALLAFALAVELVWALTRGSVSANFGGAAVSSVATLGRRLFTDYMFAFEATSILILVAMVGAVALARREGDS